MSSLGEATLMGALLTAFLGGLASRIRWIDRRDGLEHRKPRTQPVPLVGGVAILLSAALAALLLDRAPGLVDLGLRGLPWAALVAATLLGLLDDVLPGGLGARTKLLGQCVVGAILALEPGTLLGDLGAAERLLAGALAVVAMNAVNTWDHADGLSGGLGTLGLMAGAPGLAAIVAGYLPFNTLLRQPRGSGASRPGAPRAMLGDAGSHLLGVAMVGVPGAAWFLLVPLLDLGRVVLGRRRRGQAFWVGDRTHLGHRLERRGLHPVAGAAVCALIVAPPMVALEAGAGPTGTTAALTLSALLYGVAIRLTPS